MSNTRLPWWLKYVNKVMIGLQKLGVGFGGKGPVTGPNPDEFEALAGRCPVFRLDEVTG